ncbi:putative 2-polyprenyl-6-methoxyphenol hydroxylase protein [Phaeoacremonium minimum UCRPA7]|uniref:Putative 2-polyprenyl-6-methoxyphenol hydroxylase protein n=1 Tax=Phaeoacremonium minimum (strain UCR-PA7) TaxID=1286976 RepID=R8BT99_PHAM7|nr:putative 2-polyprenyl-6-methoxyphenol hydroxylase protein [Phaeoacremonium minimum UCRPA7]EOO02495.1 putative 2-polyprenyl-6-methoxyphenol hydroxylase protein [Phaeoacremonium minimum UCRPA7]
MPLKVLIAGAGIGGPALAFWLSRIGCTTTVIERSPNLRATGQQVDFLGQGLPVARMMGIENDLRAVAVKEPGMRFIDYKGQSKAYFPASDGISATTDLEVMRGDVVNILYRLTKDLDSVNYVFGNHIIGLSQDETKVHVTFANGTTENYDMVVGADGINSPTRKMMLGPSFPDHRFDLGVHMAYFTAPAQKGDPRDWTVCHVPGGKAIMTRKDKEENIRVYLATRGGCESLDAAKTLADRKAAWAQKFKGTVGAQADRFMRDLQESPEADDLFDQHLTQIRLPEGAWSKGRIVLLGDAAHCPAPVGRGGGTTSALIGAYLLTGELFKQLKENGHNPKAVDVERAAKEYERILRPSVWEKQNIGTTRISAFFPQSSLGISIIHTMGWLVAKWPFGMPSRGEESSKLLYPDYFGLESAIERDQAHNAIH